MTDDDSSRSDLARNRTDLAEDRTLLANERTFSGWARTSLATIGIGVGFNALFRTLEPVWAPKAVATIFVALGILIVWLAERRACKVQARLDAHQITTLGPINLRLIAVVFTIGAVALIVGIWALA